MTGNPYPWIVLVAIVVVVLFSKGYFKLPSLSGQPAGRSQAATPIQSFLPWSTPTSSQELGILFAKAMRQEVENDILSENAKNAAEAMKASFSAPFAAPAPAGPDLPTPPPA